MRVFEGDFATAARWCGYYLGFWAVIAVMIRLGF